MKIEGVHLQNDAAVRANRSTSRQIKTEQPQRTEQPMISTGRSIMDAFMIIQKAQAIVSQALSVSSRLMNMASETFVTGDTSRQEINTEISDIGNQLGQFGTKITIPPFNPQTQDNLALAKEDISTMREMIQSKLDFGKMSEINNNLSETNQNLAANANFYEQQIPVNENIGKSMDNAMLSIKSNPVSALTAQGNINQANLNSLI
ncbi:MAG: hypothetical protein KAZ87_11090 [Spirochaetes bacterium]|nr:hypothetical protein [Spirochaetota bacterium]